MPTERSPQTWISKEGEVGWRQGAALLLMTINHVAPNEAFTAGPSPSLRFDWSTYNLTRDRLALVESFTRTQTMENSV